MVVTILVAAIVSVGIVTYIGDSVDGFASSGNRNRLASSGRTVVDRLALELHNAVPGSVRVQSAANQQCLEFIPFVGATSYINAPFIPPGATGFDAIRFNPELLLAAPDPDPDPGDPPHIPHYAIIYPINTIQLYADAAAASSNSALAEIDSIVVHADEAGLVTVTLVDEHRFRRRSPVDRMYVARQPVSFCIVDDKLFRYSNYGFVDLQPTPLSECPAASGDFCLPTTAPNRRLISDRIVNSGSGAFSVLAPTLRRNAIVSLELVFAEHGDVVALKHEILQRNVP